MQLAHARELGMQVVEALSPACERLLLAGSVRRDKPQPKDIEIVYVPILVETSLDLFTTGLYPATEAKIVDLVHAGFWQFDLQTRRNEPKYKRLIYKNTVIELFRATRENWGLILALRTGPTDFNHLLVDRFRGAMPVDMQMKSGYLWQRGQRLPTPTESDFFTAIGIPLWPPHERSGPRLARYLHEQRLKQC